MQQQLYIPENTAICIDSLQLTENFKYICSAQSANLCILRIPILRTTVARSRDCATIVRNLNPDAHVQKPSRSCDLRDREKLLKNGDCVYLVKQQSSGTDSLA